ncbi:MAG: DNA polymerase III subunit chi [Rhodocyclaceae bacterium]|nr:DNA polymerase III subunit chi [Rhodocyclaceae bacterium]
MTDAAAPTVRFYYNSAQPLALASELLAKLHASRPQGRTLVRLPDAGTLDALDRLLWQQHDFLPHVPLDAAHAPQTPICLTAALDRPAPAGFDTCLNLAPQPAPPHNFAQHQLIIEIIPDHENDRIPARQRWHAYRQAGCTLKPFDAKTRSAL